MKKFLNKTIVFLAILILSMIAILIIFRYIEYYINKGGVNENSIAVIGNSHAQISVNDSLISKLINKKVINYADGGQSLLWSIVGARKLKHQGTRLFLIELSNSSYTSGWRAFDEKSGLRESQKIYFLKKRELMSLLFNNTAFAFKLLMELPLPSHSVSGGFIKHKKKFKEKIVRENQYDVFLPDFDDAILHEFIQENDSCFFVIFRAPQHPKYYKYIGVENEQFFIKKLNAFSDYENCLIMDFGYKYKSDSLFSDLGHMNYAGSTIFSSFFSDSLSNIKELKISKNIDHIKNNSNKKFK